MTNTSKILDIDRPRILDALGRTRGVDPMVDYIGRLRREDLGSLITLGKRLTEMDERRAGKTLVLDARGEPATKVRSTRGEEARRRRQSERREKKAAGK